MPIICNLTAISYLVSVQVDVIEWFISWSLTIEMLVEMSFGWIVGLVLS